MNHRAIQRMPEATYRSMKAINASMIIAAHQQSLLAAEQVYKGLGLDEPSPQMVTGSLLHSLVAAGEDALQPGGGIDALGYHLVTSDGRSKAGKEERENARKSGLTCVSVEQVETAIGMLHAIRRNPLAKQLIDGCLPADRELTIVWDEPEIDHPCKARIDLYNRAGILIDLKTTRSVRPDQFAWSLYDYGYWIQQPWYARALRSCGLPFQSAAIIAVTNTQPYDCVVVEATDDWFVAGEAAIEQTLPKILTAIAFDCWPGVQPDATEPIQLQIPNSLMARMLREA